MSLLIKISLLLVVPNVLDGEHYTESDLF